MKIKSDIKRCMIVIFISFLIQLTVLSSRIPGFMCLYYVWNIEEIIYTNFKGLMVWETGTYLEMNLGLVVLILIERHMDS